MNLADQIADARAKLAHLERQALGATCQEIGHAWRLVGGKNCGCEGVNCCSVLVYECTRCKDCDYGENDEAREIRRLCAAET